jgi:hypothetical protein
LDGLSVAVIVLALVAFIIPALFGAVLRRWTTPAHSALISGAILPLLIVIIATAECYGMQTELLVTQGTAFGRKTQFVYALFGAALLFPLGAFSAFALTYRSARSKK